MQKPTQHYWFHAPVLLGNTQFKESFLQKYKNTRTEMLLSSNGVSEKRKKGFVYFVAGKAVRWLMDSEGELQK